MIVVIRVRTTKLNTERLTAWDTTAMKQHFAFVLQGGGGARLAFLRMSAHLLDLGEYQMALPKYSVALRLRV